MATYFKTKNDITVRVDHLNNGSLVASIIQNENNDKSYDDEGALFYVVAVIFLYGCSILMMIASYIRKNKADQKLNKYLKEMSNVRKRERQLQILSAAEKAAEKTGITSTNTAKFPEQTLCFEKESQENSISSSITGSTSMTSSEYTPQIRPKLLAYYKHPLNTSIEGSSESFSDAGYDCNQEDKECCVLKTKSYTLHPLEELDSFDETQPSDSNSYILVS